jgi:hypothetical protein
MAAISFTSDNLRKLLRVNSYPFNESKMMVFGIRGARPVGTGFDSFKQSQQIEKTDLNYVNPRCTIGIWNPVENKIALFPASTVPNISYIKKHVQKIARANCIMTGFYSFYEKGFHNPSPRSAHQALRLATNIMMRRSNNDFVFTNDDPVEVGNPHDNIHAAYCSDVSGNYNSAGCQVIVGQPKCKARPGKDNTAFWKTFHDIIYSVPQTNFDYALFRYIDAEAVNLNGDTLMNARLRFGSKGNLVLMLQEKLAARGLFNTNKDGDFGKNTLMAVLEFQKKEFGINEADGVVGNTTAGKLGFSLPQI